MATRSLVAALVALLSAAVPARAEPVKNVVIVHGAFADGSGGAKAGAGAPVTAAAWHQKKSWALVATKDRAINPELERTMAKRAGSETIEVAASHAVYISKPTDVARLIERAAKACSQ